MFMIHGGGFFYDAPSIYRDAEIAEHIATDGIILVFPAYRLGVLGFFDVGEQFEDAPYNAGMYDIIAALRWTQLEISAFGGNPRDIVLFGHSAGGFMAANLLASPAIEANAFSRAVILSPVPQTTEHTNKPKTDAVLKQVGVSLNLKLYFVK